jgi:hypothetical protein
LPVFFVRLSLKSVLGQSQVVVQLGALSLDLGMRYLQGHDFGLMLCLVAGKLFFQIFYFFSEPFDLE